MKHFVLALVLGALVLSLPPADAHGAPMSLSVRDATIEAAGGASLAGGGSFDPGSGLLQVRGTLRLAGGVAGGPLAGLRAGDRVRWEGANILPSVSYTAGAGAERTAVTDGAALVLHAEFHGAGDGATRRAKMILATADLDPDAPGTQNLWIEGLGCGTAAITIR